MAEPSGSPRLGPFDIACVVIGGIVGVGIFFTPARVAAAVRSPGEVVLVWSLGGLLALLGAYVFAALARAMPVHGGTYAYLRASFGDLPAFLYGFANWLVIQAGALAVIGLVMVQHLDEALFGGARTPPGAQMLLACGAIALFTLVNWFGLRAGRPVQNLLIVTKLVAVFGLVLLAATGAGERPTAAHEVAPGGLGALGAAMLPVLFAYGGWQQGAFVAGAARRPARDVPLGILCGVLVVVLAYVTINLAFLDLLGFARARESPAIAVDALRAALGPEHELAPRLLGAVVVLSALGILNTICLAPPYVLYAMARDGLFPRACGVLHARWGSPACGVLLQGGAGVTLLAGAWFASGARHGELLGHLVDGVVFVDWLFFALCGIALATRPATGAASRAVGIAFAGGAAAVSAGAIAGQSAASAIGLGVVLLGIPIFFARRRGPGTAAPAD